ncbi:MAG: arginine deiminase family protein [Gammaproteobacteria bacterium]|nr:arginine deiminase family protein [Gammaproteobacteria bacterium]
MSIEFPSAAHPPFEDEADQKRVWGRRWGCTSEVGILKLTLMQPPAQAVLATDPGRNMPAGFSSDEADEGWYWQSGECAPRTDLPYREMEAQWQHLVDVLQHHGVKVVRLNQARGRFANFTRDVAIGIDGGVVVCRLGGATRRGEENAATRTLAGLGVPIIRTITGTGLLEGGSFAWINGETAVVGRSNCVNEEGAAQLEEVLHRQGVELIRTDLSFNEIHLDGVFNMLDADVALVDVHRLPFSFLEALRERQIHLVPLGADDDRWIVNGLAIAPGKYLVSEGVSAPTRRALETHDVEIVTVPFDKVHLNGGGIRCSTCPLIREPLG